MGRNFNSILNGKENSNIWFQFSDFLGDMSLIAASIWLLIGIKLTGGGMVKNQKGYVVRFSEHAVMGMLLNGLEAYSIMHNKKDSFVETCGSLFGYELKMKDGRTLYEVEMANIDTSAKRTSGDVTPNLDAMIMKTDMMACHWPHLEYLGDFHTHPYESHAHVMNTEMEKGDKRGDNRGYFLSGGDKRYLKTHSDFYKEAGCNYRVGVLVTITAITADRGKRPQHIHKNCIEFNLRRNKIWLTAYCAFEEKGKLYYTANRDQKVFLECQSVLGNLQSFL